MNGHAIEARLYAEDPDNDYLPATGTVELWETPELGALRVDTGIRSGSEITPFYDPMVAKVIAWGADRDQARTLLIRGLEETSALGTITNRPLLTAILRAPLFADGGATTAFLDELPESPQPTSADIAAVVAWLYRERLCEAASVAPGLEGWSSGGALTSAMRVAVAGEEFGVRVVDRGGVLSVTVGDAEHQVFLDAPAPVVDGVEIPVRCIEPSRGRVLAAFPAFDLERFDLTALPPGAGSAGGEGVLVAPMHGKVIAVEAGVGDVVTTGQRLVVLEAMKMEHEILADIDGVIEEVVSEGSQVRGDQLLVRIAASEG
ncbi:MAG: biotin/lipoyl-containing protein [Solirubrobacterales bacterium]